jgi:hypothetical protein
MAKEDTARREFTSAAAEVELVGSGNALLRMYDLRQAHDDVGWAFTHIEMANVEWTLNPNKDDPNNPRKVDEAIKKYDEKRSAASKIRGEFVNAARDDLGIGYDLRWTTRLIIEHWITVGILIALAVGSGIAAIRNFRRRLSVHFMAMSVVAVSALLYYNGQILWMVVLLSVSAGCAPFVLGHFRKRNEDPATDDHPVAEGSPHPGGSVH